ncbi:MAG: hypothetical protein JSS30_06935 [Verrucomicrobia bacterium]|nr:hypothetical protein [Verrucomicrobiota bacterium]
MKGIKIFLILSIFLASCSQNQEPLEEEVFGQSDEFDISHLEQDPAPSPYEILIKETMSVEGQDAILLNFY